MTRTLRERSEVLGKNARAMYCVLLVGSTEKSTALLRVVQLPSLADRWVNSTLVVAASHCPAPAAIALTTLVYWLPNLVLTQ